MKTAGLLVDLFVGVLLLACLTACHNAHEPIISAPPTAALQGSSPYQQIAAWSIASDVAEATCVATTSIAAGESQQRILIGGLLNSGNAGIACYATDGTLCGTFTTTDLPLSLAVVPREMFGDAVLLVGIRNAIDIYSLDVATWGNRSKRYVTLDEKSLVSSIVVGDDNVFIGDSGVGRGVIAVYDRSGICVGEWGRRSPAFSFVFYAVRRLSLAVSSATGLLYAGNPGRHRVEAWSQDGHWEESLGFGEASTDIDGFCGCCNPIDIAALSSGEIVTAEKSLWRVKVLSPSGKLRAVVMDATLRNAPPPPRSEAASRIGGAMLRLAVLPAVLPASEESCERIVILDEERLQVSIFAATAPGLLPFFAKTGTIGTL